MPAGPITSDQRREIHAARRRARKVRRAATVAAISGWTLAVFAALTLLLGLFDAASLLLGAALAAVAWSELRGAAGMRRFEPRAPRRLAINQIVLAAAIIAYAGWKLVAAVTGPNPYDEQLASAGGEVRRMLEPIAELHTLIAVALYGSLIPLTVLFQGAMAWWHMSRAKHLRAYLDATPTWVIELQRDAPLRKAA